MKNELKKRNIEDKNWFWICNDFISRYKGYLRPTCISVYMSLCFRADNETQRCYPSEEVIACDAGTTSRSVQKYIGILEELGIISITLYQGEFGRWPNNVYTLLNRSHWKTPEETVSYGIKNNRLFLHPEEKKDKIHKKRIPTNNTNHNNTSNLDIESKFELYKKINQYRDKYKPKNSSP